MLPLLFLLSMSMLCCVVAIADGGAVVADAEDSQCESLV